MRLSRKIYHRRQIKSSEGEFIWELENMYELSAKLSTMILMSAKECLVRKNNLREGQIEVSVVCLEERGGKVIEKLEKKKVRLTIDNGIEDIEVQKEFGRLSLRRIKIQRICNEAIEQGGVLSQEDLSKYLSSTVRTIQRDKIKDEPQCRINQEVPGKFYKSINITEKRSLQNKRNKFSNGNERSFGKAVY